MLTLEAVSQLLEMKQIMQSAMLDQWVYQLAATLQWTLNQTHQAIDKQTLMLQLPLCKRYEMLVICHYSTLVPHIWVLISTRIRSFKSSQVRYGLHHIRPSVDKTVLTLTTSQVEMGLQSGSSLTTSKGCELTGTLMFFR